MTTDFLTEDEARGLVEEYMAREQKGKSTQALLRESSVTPQLGNFVVKFGKVSDSIHGGKGSCKMDLQVWERDFLPYMSGLTYTATHFTVVEKGKEKHKVRVDYENPILQTKDDVPLRLMVRTDRISTHDINRGEIPFKDQILAMNHNVMRRLTQDVLGTSQFDVPGLTDTSVVIAAENLRTIPVEMVVRAYMAKSDTSTSLYHAWKNSEANLFFFCGHLLDLERLIPNGKLPYVMDTPSTKSDEHDVSLNAQELIQQGMCTFDQYQQMRNAALVAFGVVSQFVKGRGLILADTKTEHGINRKEELVSQDELYTMDSSRFWRIDEYNYKLEELAAGRIQELDPLSLSKQFARDFSKGDQGYTDEQRRAIAARYIIGIQHLTGQRFKPDMRSREERVVSGLQTIVEHLVA